MKKYPSKDISNSKHQNYTIHQKNIKTPPFSAQNQTQMRCAAAVVAAAATPAPPSPVQCSVATDLRLLRVGNGPKN